MEYGASDLCLVKCLVELDWKHSSQLSAESLIWLEVGEKKAPRCSSQHHSSNRLFSQMREKIEF
jgi:hypothetical protein